MFAAMAIVGAASQVAGLYETTLAERASIESINLSMKQREIQLNQKKLSVYSNTEKMLKHQTAQMTTRGVGMGSPSFNAIQRDTLNISSKAARNIDTEREFSEYNAMTEKRNVRQSTYAKLFGTVGASALGFAALMK